MYRATHRLVITIFGLVSMPLGAQLGPPGTQFWNQSSPGVGIAMEANANFGYALAAGDFDCDGFDDLAIGMPGEDLVGGANAGRLVVLYSNGVELSTDDRQIWGQNSPVVEDDAEPNDRFSSVLAAGYFNADTCADLAIGVPQEDIGADSGAGAVNVLYGSSSGLTGDSDDFWHQDSALLQGSAEPGDQFGAALAVGDFNDDGLDDLAIGSPGEDVGAVETAGMVHVVFGSLFGLAAGESVALWRGNGLNGSPQAGEGLGRALTAGQFGILPGDELAIGAPGRDLAGADQGGVVLLVSDVPGNSFNSEWSQETMGVPGIAEDFDRFGSVLAAGDFDGDGIDELAVGVPEEDREAAMPILGSMGAVNILDFDGDGHVIFTQDDLNPEQEELNDQFGGTLAAADFDGDGIDDLAVGAPLEDLGPILGAGLIHVLYGEAVTGLSNDRDQIWIQTIDPSQDFDEFGGALVAGRFAGHSGADLAIGVPYESIGAFSETGGVNILYSVNLFSDGFESGDTSAWSDVVP